MSSSVSAPPTVWITPEDVAEARVTTPVNFGPLGEQSFLRTYARDLPGGGREDWHQTMARVVNGNLNFVSSIYTSRQEALDLYHLLLTHQIVPGGRHLWATGVQMGNVAINNCHGADHTARFSEHFEHSFLRLMEGGGVGTNVSDRFINSRDSTPATDGKPWKVRGKHEIHIVCSPNHKDYERTVELEHEQDILAGPSAFFIPTDPELGQTSATRTGFLDKYVVPFTSLLSREFSYRSTPTDLPNVQFLQVEDSREGWAEVLVQVLDAYVNHKTPQKFVIDVSQIRAFGEPIRTFGGTASGPEAFMLLLKRIEAILGSKVGELVTWQDFADIEHWIAVAVISGGSRRSARMMMKYWADPGIHEFINLKTPLSTGHVPHHSTNISVVVDNKFFRRLEAKDEHAVSVAKAIVDGMLRNGEPGIINASNHLKGEAPGAIFKKTNPCVPDYTWVETEDGPRMVRDLIGKQFVAVVDGKKVNSTEHGFFFTGVKSLVRLRTTRSTVDLTPDHLVLCSDGEFREAQALVPGDTVQISEQAHVPQISFSAPTREQQVAEAMGWLYGDGNIPSDARCLNFDFWNADRNYGLTLIRDVDPEARLYRNEAQQRIRLVSRTLLGEAEAYVTGRGKGKRLSERFDELPLDQAVFFLRGWFGADGSVQGTAAKGVSARLTCVDEQALHTAQRVLWRLGIKSTLYRNRRPACTNSLPDGKGGVKLYRCQALHELIISRQSLRTFYTYVLYGHGAKAEKLKDLIDQAKRDPYADAPHAVVLSVDPIEGDVPVYDCTIPDGHVFTANHLKVHNCAEITFVSYPDLPCFEVCCIGHLNLAMLEDPLKAATLLTRFLIRATCAPVQDPRMKANIERNRRIGAGILGYADWLVLNGIRYSDSAVHVGVRNTLYSMSQKVKEEAVAYARDLRIVTPIKTTTIAPTGTVSMLSGVTSGMQPVFAKFFKRRVRFADGKDAEQIQQHRDGGYHVEPDIYNSNTSVVEYVTQSTLFNRAISEALEQNPEWTPDQARQHVVDVFQDEADLDFTDVLAVQDMLQEVWADNSISVTANIRQGLSWDSVFDSVMHYAKRLKGLTLFPERSFHQPPLERITWEQYQELEASGYPIEVSQDEQSCKNGVCPIK